MNKGDILKLRAPDLGLILNTAIGCCMAVLVAIPVYFLCPQEHAHVSLLQWSAGSVMFIFAFYIFALVPVELIVLNMFFYKFELDALSKTVAIRKHLFFIPYGETKTYDFSQVKLRLSREFMVGTHHGLASGHVWKLYLKVARTEFNLGSSIFKKTMLNKRKKINSYLRSK